MKYLFLVLFLTACADQPEEVKSEMLLREDHLKCSINTPCDDSDDGITCKDSCGNNRTLSYCSRPENGYLPSKMLRPVYKGISNSGTLQVDPSDLSDCDFFLMGNDYIYAK